MYFAKCRPHLTLFKLHDFVQRKAARSHHPLNSSSAILNELHVSRLTRISLKVFIQIVKCFLESTLAVARASFLGVFQNCHHIIEAINQGTDKRHSGHAISHVPIRVLFPALLSVQIVKEVDTVTPP